LKRFVIFTDLDGTLLEADGTLSPALEPVLDRLRAQGIPVVPVTSKTRVELLDWVARLDSGGTGAFENGAGLLDGAAVEILPRAVPVVDLREALIEASRAAEMPLVTLSDMTDDEIAERTGLARPSISRARAREYDLPFLPLGGELSPRFVNALSGGGHLRLSRGDRFFHLSGDHGKEDAVRRILDRHGAAATTIGLGDAPNDSGFLARMDVAVIIPRENGPDASLRERVPLARVAPEPAGAGWAAAVARLIEERAA